MLWYIISLQKKSTIAVNKDPSIPSLTNQHEGPTKRGNALPAALPVLPQQVEDEAAGEARGLAALIQGQIMPNLQPCFFWGGKSKKIISSTMGWLVWIPA